MVPILYFTSTVIANHGISETTSLSPSYGSFPVEQQTAEHVMLELVVKRWICDNKKNFKNSIHRLYLLVIDTILAKHRLSKSTVVAQLSAHRIADITWRINDLKTLKIKIYSRMVRRRWNS